MQRTRIALSCFAIVGMVCLSLFLHQTLLKPEPKEEVTSTDPEPLPATGSTSTVSPGENPEPEPGEVVDETPELTQVESTQSVLDVDNEPFIAPLKTVELTDFRGEMKKGRLAKKPSVDITSHPSLPWFTKDASQIAFPESTESLDRDYFFAWVQLNPNHLHSINRDSFQALQVEIFDGGSEYRRVRLPRTSDSLTQLLEQEAVLALGNQPVSEKVGPNFREEIAESISSDSAEVFITLMTTGNLTHWQNEIENLGAVIEHWDPTIRVLVASVPYGKLMDLAEWDFVQSVEPVGTVELTLDSAVPVAGADGLRTHNSVNGSFTGITGENITVGVIDTGLNLAHPDISVTRDSICGESFQTMSNGILDTDDLWVDVEGHGTHVTSILVGAGVDNRSRAGVAPGVKHIRFAKAFAKTAGGASSTSILKSMDYFTQESSCEWNGTQSVERKPNVINMSLSNTTADAGYQTGAKKLDWAVWNHNQLYVVSQGNARNFGYSQYGSAKNALPVGWLTDALFANYLSSIGPTSDRRMVPKVSMSGDNILAADGNGAESGYVRKSGTSMSSPAVAGIATLLMGTDEAFATNPALVRAQLMATAIKPDAFFDDEAYAPRTNTNGTGYINNQYGMGSVSARTAISQGPNDEWSSHSAVSEIENDEYAYIEIVVPENTHRLDIVLTWDEPPNDNVGSAVMADLDLYLGPDDDCDVTECGEQVSSSRVDNLEYLIISAPEPGVKRITVIPHNIFQFAPRIAVSWMVLARSTPQLDIELESENLNAENTRRPQLELTVTNDEFVAAGVSLYFACRNQGTGDCDYWSDTTESLWQPGSQITREDGTMQDLTGVYIGAPIFVGEIVSSETQEITLVFPPAIKTSSHQLYVSAASANSHSDVDAINVLVDDQELPPLATTIMNDYASSAFAFAGESGSVTVDLAAGSREPGELAIDTEVLRTFVNQRGWSAREFFNFTEGLTQSRSAWYKMSVTTASKYGIQITSQDPSNANVSFQLLAADELFDPPAANIWTTDQHEFYLQPNKNYYLRVNTYATVRIPELEFTWQKLDTKPVNDQFTDRVEITGESGDVTGNNAYATVEIGEPGGHVSVGTTWFKWVAPEDGVWNFEADAPYSSDSPQVYVFHGSSVDNLRLISDPSYFGADVPVIAGEEYQICVSSDAQFTDFQGSYELTWEASNDSSLMPNDMFANATSISGSQGSRTKCSPCSGIDRTVEVGEPLATTSHSLWWQWDAPSTEQFTFRISNAQVDTLSIFTGSALSALSLEASGPEFVLDATSGETYYIALHRASGLEYSLNTSNNFFQWGVTPEYDRISTPLTLSGMSGMESMVMKYATTTPDESLANGLTSAGVHSSVWASWTAPTNFDGWMRFTTETWEDADLRSATDQYFLGIHERSAVNNAWDLVASTDRSFIISGKPHAIFQPTSGREYRVQVALRSNNTTFSTGQTEADIFWEETTAPPWLTSDANFYEIGSSLGNDIEELIDPSAGALVGRNLDRLLLTVADEMLVLGLSDGTNDLSVVETIPYEDEDGQSVQAANLSVLGWNPARQALYAPLSTGFRVFEGLDQSDRAFSSCSVTSDFSRNPTQIVTESTGRFVYKIGQHMIAAYRVDGPCELTLVQVTTSLGASHTLKVQIPAMEGFQAAVFGPNEEYLYGLSNNRLLTFAKSAETGELNQVSNTLHSTWLTNTAVNDSSDVFDGARVALDPSGDYLFAIGWNNPAVAIFDLATDRAEPTALAALDNYYIDYNQFFPTHIRRPSRWDFGQCRIQEVHNTDNPTVDVFCRYMNYVVTWDKDTQELYIADWSSDEQADRFGNQLPQFRDMLDSFGVSTTNGQHSYVVVDDWLDSIHRFERVTGATTLTPTTFTPYDTYLLRLVAMDVEPNEIELGSRTISSCEAISGLEIDNVTYTVLNSKWQVRNSVGEDWEDVTGTVRTDNQLCPHDPADARDYRMVFEATINGTTDSYSSDVMVELPTSN